jgi:hypothetical protein
VSSAQLTVASRLPNHNSRINAENAPRKSGANATKEGFHKESNLVWRGDRRPWWQKCNNGSKIGKASIQVRRSTSSIQQDRPLRAMEAS